MRKAFAQNLSIMMAGFFLAMVFFSGCSPKEKKAPAPEINQLAPGELPVLAQNQAPPAERPVPDYSFTPVPNDIQPIPEGEETSPLVD